MTFPQEKKLNTELPFDPTTPLLDTFLAAFFTMAERQKQPRYLSTDKWVNKMWYIHTRHYYLTVKRNEVLKHACNVDDLQKHNTQRKKPVRREPLLYDAIYMKCPE